MGADLSDGRRRRLGKTISSYREAFFTEDRAHPGQQYRTYSPQAGADRRIREAISDICVSMKAEDYLTLPDYTEDIVPVVLDAKAKRAYDKLERDMLLQVDEATITAQSAAVLNGKLLQLCSGAVYDEDGPGRRDPCLQAGRFSGGGGTASRGARPGVLLVSA